MPDQELPLTMGRFSEVTGCDRETIRYYERIDLMASPARTKSGYRIFKISDVRRMRFILRCRQLGFSIEDIRGLLALVDENSYCCADIQEVTQTQLKEVQRKISDLQAMEKVLNDMLQTCENNEIPECPIIDKLFD